MMERLKNSYKVHNFINFFDNKVAFTAIFIIILGILIPTFSAVEFVNFWLKLYDILNHKFYCCLFFTALGFSLYKYIYEQRKNNNYIIRVGYQRSIKSAIVDAIFYSIYLCLITYLLAISFSLFISFGKFSVFKYGPYNISILLIVSFQFIKQLILSVLISVVFVMLVYLVNYKIYTCLVILNSLLFLLPGSGLHIESFYNIPYLYQYFLMKQYYSSVFLEVVCLLIMLGILFIVIEILYKVVISKKRDM